MRWTEILESPRIVGPTDWNLGDPKVNRARAREILAYAGLSVLKRFGSARLVHTGGPHGGLVALVRDDDELDYEMRYETSKRPDLGRCATQIRVWRRRTAIQAGLAKIAFEDFLLANFDTIVSDADQTSDGVAFWQTQMAGLRQTKAVGIIRDGKIDVFPRTEKFDDWLTRVDGWGASGRFRQRLFFISNRPPTEIIEPPTNT